MSVIRSLAASLDGFRSTDFYFCWKSAEIVRVAYNASTNVTLVSFFDEATGTTGFCSFWFRGNPFAISDGITDYPIVPGGSGSGARAVGAATPLTRFTSGETDAAGTFTPEWTARSLQGVTAADFLSVLTDQTAVYPRFVALFDDATTVTGSAFADELETGAGNDTVAAGGGDDLILKWAAGSLSVDGGAGRDTLDFTPAFITGILPPETHTLFVDLLAGTGTSQYGGALTIASVERIVTLENIADTVLGSNRADTILASFAEDDLYRMRGGDDLVSGAVFRGNLSVDGGAGTDTLAIDELTAGTVLGLADQTRNAGDLAGCRFAAIEIFDLSARTGLGGVIEIRGAVSGDTVRFDTFRLFPGGAIASGLLSLGGGNDSAFAGGGADTLLGGAGDDTLTGENPALAVFGGADLLDGGAGNDSLAGGVGNDSFLGGRGLDALAGDGGNDLLRGGEGADSMLGGAGDDSLLGGSGRDVLSGGRDRDRMAGGSGADDFVFAAGFGRDRIADFAVGTDDLDFRGHAGVATLADLAITDSAPGAVIADPDGARVILLGVLAADLLPGDILV